MHTTSFRRTLGRRARATALAGAAAATALALTAAVPGSGVGLGAAKASAAAPHRVTGNDISWPQCPKGMGIPSRQGEGQPMPTRSAKFVIVGLTNGPGFYPNPCLASQVKWVKRHHVYAAAYAMTTYPRPKQLAKYGTTGPHSHKSLVGKVWNAGYAEAMFNVANMKRVGLTSPIVWIDVEPYPVAPWSGSKYRNAQVVRGAVSAYQDAGYRVGFYSTSTLWPGIVGNLRFGYPEWRSAGQTSMASALYKCSHYQFQGGRAVVAQWWTPKRDFDVMCPGYATKTVMKRFFHKY